MYHSPQPPHNLHLWFFRLIYFLDQWRSIPSNRFVLNMVQCHHLQLRYHPPLSHMFWEFNVKVAAAHHPIIHKEVNEVPSKQEQLNHLLVVLVSIPVCLLLLGMLVASSPYLTFSGLIIICIYLLLRCLLSDMCGSLFSMVIMPSPLISRMFIYIFLLVSVIVIFIICLAQYAISVEGFTFWAGHSPQDFHSPHLTYFVPLPLQGFPYYYRFG